MTKTIYVVQAAASGILAWISSKMGILFPVLGVLFLLMVLDYITGMMASKTESLEYPDDPSYGWSSKKGLKGIIKKVGYLCIIAVAMVIDFIILKVAYQIGIEVHGKAYFGILVTVWYILNEMLSIIENTGRMGANVPEWLSKNIAILKGKIDSNSEN
ncbi:MAG: phage holin family protein [Clostridiales bacterium]|nr:phage holin family protein [Clostridiales bacterium]